MAKRLCLDPAAGASSGSGAGAGAASSSAPPSAPPSSSAACSTDMLLAVYIYTYVNVVM